MPDGKRFSTAADLLRAAAGLCRRADRVLLGITGPPGSGKTTLARWLADRVPGAAYLPMDGFHHADVALDALGRRDRKGAPDTFDGWGYLALLQRLREAPQREPGHAVYAPMFERDLEQPLAGAIAIRPAATLVISEGNYLLLGEAPWPAVAGCFDQIWYCEVDPAERRRRLIARHHEFGKDLPEARAWVERVDAANARLVEAGRERADAVVSFEAVRDLPH